MSSPIDPALLPPRQQFRFSFDVKRFEMPAKGATLSLDESFALPTFGSLDGEEPFAEVRMGWNPVGIVWQLIVAGRSQLPWCRESRLDESDGLQVWVDTRGTFNIHRASRYCHRFVFLPRGGGSASDQPLADQLLINRARENATPVRPRQLQAISRCTSSGYTLTAVAAAAALGGFDPEQQPRIGFTYAVLDRERGLQTLSTGPGFPYEEDPSCWAEAVLVGA
ncbi:MAG: hypothetical protein KDA44_10635 [Planctomycetales bacterium]|nr:hypothetical protein [Planctomycetales bacterium]